MTWPSPTPKPPLDLSINLVTDTHLCGSVGVAQTALEAVRAGATAVQLRDPGCSDEQFVQLGRELRSALEGSNVPLIVNDRVHLVEAIGADGVHVGQTDLDPVSARERLAPGGYLGLSVQSLDHVRQALRLPPGTVDYLGVGPVWPQSTKSDAAPPSSPEVLAEIVRTSPWPCVAIGGIDKTRVPAVRRAGAAGVAVVSAICGQPDVQAATRDLRQTWENTR